MQQLSLLIWIVLVVTSIVLVTVILIKKQEEPSPLQLAVDFRKLNGTLLSNVLNGISLSNVPSEPLESFRVLSSDREKIVLCAETGAATVNDDQVLILYRSQKDNHTGVAKTFPCLNPTNKIRVTFNITGTPLSGSNPVRMNLVNLHSTTTNDTFVQTSGNAITGIIGGTGALLEIRVNFGFGRVGEITQIALLDENESLISELALTNFPETLLEDVSVSNNVFDQFSLKSIDLNIITASINGATAMDFVYGSSDYDTVDNIFIIQPSSFGKPFGFPQNTTLGFQLKLNSEVPGEILVKLMGENLVLQEEVFVGTNFLTIVTSKSGIDNIIIDCGDIVGPNFLEVFSVIYP